jgi:hypothetical protein
MNREKGMRKSWIVSWVIAAAAVADSEARAQEYVVGEAVPEESARAWTEHPRPLPESPIARREEPGSEPTWAELSGQQAYPPSAALFIRPPALDAPGVSEDDPQEVHDGKHAELSDLTLLNFFTEGWADPWLHRHRHTPDMALLRVTTNFLERELRLDYAGTRHVNRNAKVERTDFLNSLIAYGLNRRLMIEVIANYQWNHKDGSNIVDGAGAAILARFQLVDTETSSYAFQMRASAPNRGIGQTTTTLSPSLTGWQDLDAAIGLDRVGVYYSLTWDNLSGPIATGARTNSLGYDLSLAKTWTDPKTSVVGNFSTFLELFATTDLNGPTPHHTAVSLTPGIRFWFVPENSLTIGVDFPVSYPHPYSEVFRITYILNF